jgi:hypothetical protein
VTSIALLALTHASAAVIGGILAFRLAARPVGDPRSSWRSTVQLVSVAAAIGGESLPAGERELLGTMPSMLLNDRELGEFIAWWARHPELHRQAAR